MPSFHKPRKEKSSQVQKHLSPHREHLREIVAYSVNRSGGKCMVTSYIFKTAETC